MGAAVHTGLAFVGSTGADGAVSDFTALGDVVNTTARLASEAAAGELLVSVDAVAGGRTWTAALEHRTLAVRGRSDAIEVDLGPAVLIRALNGSVAGRERLWSHAGEQVDVP